MNKIPATTKLEWALQMAESVALLHNHWRGVIVHDDVQPFQWLITDDGNIKMNGKYCFLLLGPIVCWALFWTQTAYLFRFPQTLTEQK